MCAQEIKPCMRGFPDMGPPVVHSLDVQYSFKAAYTAAENILRGMIGTD